MRNKTNREKMQEFSLRNQSEIRWLYIQMKPRYNWNIVDYTYKYESGVKHNIPNPNEMCFWNALLIQCTKGIFCLFEYEYEYF